MTVRTLCTIFAWSLRAIVACCLVLDYGGWGCDFCHDRVRDLYCAGFCWLVFIMAPYSVLRVQSISRVLVKLHEQMCSIYCGNGQSSSGVAIISVCLHVHIKMLIFLYIDYVMCFYIYANFWSLCLAIEYYSFTTQIRQYDKML